MFQDLSEQVIIHDAVVDQTNHQIERVKVDTEAVNTQLNKGILNARRARLLKWIIFIIILIILLALGLGLGIFFGVVNKSKSSTTTAAVVTTTPIATPPQQTAATDANQ